MDKKLWRRIGFWVLISEAVGLVSGFLTRDAVEVYGQMAIKPPLSPPGWLFPVVWTVLYALMGIGAGLVSMKAGDGQSDKALNYMVMQLAVNFFWPLLFFNAEAYGFALLWLGLLLVFVIGMTLEFRKISSVASILQIPYILWLVFAAYLNAGVWLLNR